MPTYVITSPDGRKFKVTGEGTKEDALKAVQNQEPAARKSDRLSSPKPSMLMDFAKAVPTGLREGAEMLAGTPGDVRELTGDLAEWTAGQFGASPETAQKARTLSRLASPFTAFAPTTEDIQQSVTNPAVGLPRQPETIAGDYGRTIGQFFGAGGVTPGGIVRKGASILAPAVASETAGQITEGEPEEPYARLAGALLGGGLASGGTRSSLAKAVKGAPTSQQLKTDTNKAYKELRAMGIKYDADEYNRMLGTLASNFQRDGIRRATFPKAWGLLDEMMQGANRSPDFDDIDAMKKAFRNLLKSPDESAAAGKALGVLDEFELNAPAINTAGLAQQQVNQARKTARNLALRNIKTRLLDEVADDAATLVSGLESGIKRKTATMLRSKKGKRTFKDESERDALVAIIQGDVPRNVLSQAGRFGFDFSNLGSRASLMPGGAAGGLLAAGEPLSALALGSGASLAKVAGRKMTERDLETARALIRGGQGSKAKGQKALTEDAKRRRLLSALLLRQSSGRPTEFTIFGDSAASR